MEYLMIKREAAIKRIESKIRHCKKHLEEFDLPFNTENYTCHGGWSKGFWEGRLSVLEDLLDDFLEKESNSWSITLACRGGSL